MQSANLSGPLKGLRPYQALIGPTQASGLAGGFDCGRGLLAEVHQLGEVLVALLGGMPRQGIP